MEKVENDASFLKTAKKYAHSKFISEINLGQNEFVRVRRVAISTFENLLSNNSVRNTDAITNKY